MSLRKAQTVRAELVEALSFFKRRKKGQGFDRLSPNGVFHSILRKTGHV